MNKNLHIFPSPEETAQAVAEMILEKSIEKLQFSEFYNIALSGGSTPKLLFTVLADKYLEQIPWSAIRLFWVDERCVPPTDTESNFGMTYHSLLKRVPIPESNIFRMVGEAEPHQEALRYQQLLAAQLPVIQAIPQFDLVLLGMGDDGHTASIFPDNPELLWAEPTVAVAVHPVSGQQRITLTGATINAAAQVAFLITGVSKAGVIRQILNKEADYEKYPSAHIPAANFFLDAAAASQVSL